MKLHGVIDCTNVSAWGDEEGTNASSIYVENTLADTPVLVAGTTIFCLILPLVLFEFRYFPIGTTSAVLLGATLMVLAQVVSQDEVYEILGHKDNLTTIFLLLGMMLLAQYFDREQLLIKLLRRVLKPNHTFENYIWRVCLLSFVLSALFTNDACCAILTPLLLKFWESQERPRTEIETMLLGIATSANIGSVTTIFGNPQMALIAARTSVNPYMRSRLDLRNSLIYLGPPAIVIFCLNLGFLVIHHRLKTRHIEKSKLISEVSHSSQEMAGLTNNGHIKGICDGQSNGVLKYTDREDFLYEGVQRDDKMGVPCQLETIHEDEVLEITSSRSQSIHDMDTSMSDHEERQMNEYSSSTSSDSSDSSDNEEDTKNPSSELVTNPLNSLNDIDYKPNALQSQTLNNSGASLNTKTLDSHGLKLTDRGGIYRSLSAVSAAEFLQLEGDVNIGKSVSCENVFMASDSIVFQLFLGGMMVSVIALFLASTQEVTFDMGLVPMGAAVIIITFDAMINRQNAVLVMKRVDWSIIMMFFGIFIWMYGLNKTGVPHYIWNQLGLGGSTASLSALDIVILGTFIVLGSNIFSNVPLTIIVLEQLIPCRDQKDLVIYLAWCSTIAGNLTLFGSVANLIVAQKSKETLDFQLTFFGYMKFGFITTTILLTVGILMLYGCLRI